MGERELRMKKGLFRRHLHSNSKQRGWTLYMASDISLQHRCILVKDKFRKNEPLLFNFTFLLITDVKISWLSWIYKEKTLEHIQHADGLFMIATKLEANIRWKQWSGKVF